MEELKSCPFCGGFLAYEIGYATFSTGMKRVTSEDRIYCVNCGRHRYLTEYAGHPSPKGRADALPHWVLGLVPGWLRNRAIRAEEKQQRHRKAPAYQEEAATEGESRYGESAG